MRRVLPALLLVAYGVAFATAFLAPGVPAFDDHPGQLFRLWHALERSVPGGHGPADWNPDWWAGYPELQFYPPGFAILGAVLRALALWQPGVDSVYRVLCGAVFLLPGLTTYALLARLTGDRWLALPPAFLALVLSAGLRSGVEESVRWGMLTSRLAAAGLPLLPLALRGWLDEGRRPGWAAPLLAAILLAHPAAGPAAFTILGVAAALALALRPGRQTLWTAAGVAGLGAALAAFWLLPLLWRQAWLVPLAWGDFSPGAFAGDLASRPVLLGAALGAPLAWLAVVRRRRPSDALVALLPPALAATTLLDALLFARGWSPVEPGRVADSVVHALLWSAGLGLAALAPRGSRRRVARDPRPAAALLLAGVAAAAGALDGGRRGEPTLTLWPAGPGWPTLAAVERQHDLGRLWAALAGGSDRVLFLASSLRLDGDPAWYAAHSHATALTPLRAGREILHGTYTHPSPVAARVYGGRDAPARLDRLAEELDGRVLLGQPWARLRPDAFEAFARRFRVATLVVPAAQLPRAAFLGDVGGPGGTWVRGASAGALAVLERRDRTAPPWPRVERISHRRYRVQVPPSGGLWVPTGIAFYPLWQVKSAAGRLPTRADAWGLLEFRVPIDVFDAELVYAEGVPEWAGLALTLAGAGVAVAAAWRARGRPPPRAAAGRTAAVARRRR